MQSLIPRHAISVHVLFVSFNLMPCDFIPFPETACHGISFHKLYLFARNVVFISVLLLSYKCMSCHFVSSIAFASVSCQFISISNSIPCQFMLGIIRIIEYDLTSVSLISFHSSFIWHQTAFLNRLG